MRGLWLLAAAAGARTTRGSAALTVEAGVDAQGRWTSGVTSAPRTTRGRDKPEKLVEDRRGEEEKLGKGEDDPEGGKADRCSFLPVAPKCGEGRLHTCGSAKEAAVHCPAACNVSGVNPFLACSISCVKKDECSKANPGLAWYDNDAKECVDGTVNGCAHYSAKDVCDKCAEHFVLSSSGKCDFLGISLLTYHYFGYGVMVLLALVLIPGLPYVVYRLSQPVGNVKACTAGWRHYARQHAWNFSRADASGRPSRWSLGTSMHSEVRVGGVGLCLYYNSLVFCALMASVCAFVVFVIGQASGFSRWGVDVLDDDFADCHAQSVKGLEQLVVDVHDYHRLAWRGFAVLYLVLVAMTAKHVKRQHACYTKFDADTNLMADYGLMVKGLPVDADEQEIFQHFGQFSPHGISLAYDFGERQDLVQRLIDRHVHNKEAALGLREPLADEDNKEEVRASLASIPGSGTAFVVFKVEAERVACFEAVRGGHGSLFRGEIPLTAKEVWCEPDTLRWHNFRGTYRPVVTARVKAMLILLAQYVAVVFAVFVPIVYFLLADAHEDEEEKQSTFQSTNALMGYLLAITNSVLYCLVFAASANMCFRFKEAQDFFNYIGCLCVLSGTLSMMWYVAQNTEIVNTSVDKKMGVFGGHVGEGMSDRDQQALDHIFKRLHVKDKIYGMLVPGWICLQYVIYYIFCVFLDIKALLFYIIPLPMDVRSNKKASVQDAEATLGAHPFEIEFDYSYFPCQFLSCFVMLYYESAASFHIMLIFIGWLVYTYMQMKYAHLRCMGIVEYTTTALDDMHNYTMGVPVAAVLGFAAKYAELGPLYVAGVFGAGLGFYWAVVYCTIGMSAQLDEGGTKPYEDAVKEIGYSWYNTNPVHVLKAAYLVGPGDHEISYFVRGKEYLQGDPWRSMQIDACKKGEPEIDCTIRGALKFTTGNL